MFCVSLSFETAEQSVREQFPYGPEILQDLEQGVFLSTCNRVEVYGVGDLYPFVNTYFQAFKTRIFIYEDKLACRHLFRVAAGLDSMVLGEDEILGQVKHAFADAQKDGRTGYELNTIFRAAITAAKKVKTDTLLSKSSVSTATLAAAACEKYWKEKSQRTHLFAEADAPDGTGTNGRKEAVESMQSTPRVLLIGGSGDIGRKTLKDLVSYDHFDITATIREHGIRDKVKLIDYRDRYEALATADIVVSATKNPKFTVTAEQVREAERIAREMGEVVPEERLYVDLAVPRDIDPELMPAITIDDLSALAAHNNEIKQSEAKVAEQIIEGDLETLYKDLAFHDLLPVSEQVRERVGVEEAADWNRMLYSFRDYSSAEEFEGFAAVLKRLADALPVEQIMKDLSNQP